MKKWTTPEISTLELAKTEHNWTGRYRDGGYIGDGEISGHLRWDKPECPGNTTPTEPTQPDPGPGPSTGDVVDALS